MNEWDRLQRENERRRGELSYEEPDAEELSVTCGVRTILVVLIVFPAITGIFCWLAYWLAGCAPVTDHTP